MSLDFGSPSVVAEIGSPVTVEDIDAYAKLKDIERQDSKVRAVLIAWSAQEDLNRISRKKYANWIVGALLVQGVAVNVAFFMIGRAALVVDPWVANGFILSVFGEMVALTHIVFKHFFPSDASQITKLVEGI